jgi:hypothetical protein
MLGGVRDDLYVRFGQVNSLGDQGRMEIVANKCEQKGMRTAERVA